MEAPELSPKLKIELSELIDCGASSGTASIDGSNVVNAFQSIVEGKLGLGEALDDEAAGDTAADGPFEEELYMGIWASVVDDWLKGVPSIAAFGIVNVKVDDRSRTFSDWRRERRSFKFSFSDCVCSFFASKAATLSSS